MLCKETDVALAVVKVRAQHWLHKQVGVTAVVDEPSCIPHMPRIQQILHLPADNTPINHLLASPAPNHMHSVLSSMPPRPPIPPLYPTPEAGFNVSWKKSLVPCRSRPKGLWLLTLSKVQQNAQVCTARMQL